MKELIKKLEKNKEIQLLLKSFEEEFENNFEINAFIYDRRTAIRMKGIFHDDLNHCIPYEEYMRHRRLSFPQRLWESLVRLFSPLM